MALKDAQRRLAQTVAKQHLVSRTATGTSETMKAWTATYVAAESFDSNCTHIQIAGADIRGVPRLQSAWSTTPTSGTNLLVIGVGNAMIIAGVIIGRPKSSPLLGAGG